MYFPYLRGKQYELIALRELAEKNLIGSKIIPIIEPVKPTATLLNTLECYSSNDRKIALIFNPLVGDFVKEIKDLKEEEKKKNSPGVATGIFNQIINENVIKSYIMNRNVSDKISKKNDKDEFLIINNSRDCVNAFINAYVDDCPKYSLITNDVLLKKTVKRSRVLLSDCFIKQLRNVDYSTNQDEFFSDIHLVYEKEKYIGFSDYTVVGEKFVNSGFAPVAVTIHIVYFNNEKELRIRHFVSDSNDDINDPAGKFGEALEKLVVWCRSNNIIVTEGLKGFYNCYDMGRYPGLGTVKKLSIMHHIELINKFLEKEI